MSQATTFDDLATEAQRQTLAALKHAHDLSLRGAELTMGLLRRDPGTGSVPSAQDTVEGAFAFAGQVLQQQKAYALRMTEIVTGATAPEPAANTK